MDKAPEPQQGIYYDITSVLSYSTEISFVEWGTTGSMKTCTRSTMGGYQPKDIYAVFYNVFTGSIVDVSTIRIFLKYLNFFDLKQKN